MLGVLIAGAPTKESRFSRVMSECRQASPGRLILEFFSQNQIYVLEFLLVQSCTLLVGITQSQDYHGRGMVMLLVDGT